MFFRVSERATKAEKATGEVKEWTLDKDTPYLPLPGLVGPVTHVRVHGQDLPERRPFTVRDFRLTEDRLPPIATDMPMWLVVEGNDGTPVLMRSVCSNNGIWQKGATIAVWGTWSDIKPQPRQETLAEEVDPAAIAAASARRLADMKPEALRQQAQALGIFVAEDMTDDALIQAILRKAGLPETAPPRSPAPGKVPYEMLRLSLDELKKIAADYNLTYKPGTRKEDFAAIVAKAAGYSIEE
jgi:hypothetical protein